MSTKLSSLFFFLVLSSVHAANDWSKPCFDGVCHYDLPDTTDGPSGTLKIWGANTAITDVTTAAGWEILGCDPNALEQEIRIVCRNGNDDSGCGHLFSTPSDTAVQVRAASPSATAPGASGTTSPPAGKEQGAVGKIVRLPQNCGKQPFARISQAWIHADQSIPTAIAKRLVRRAGEGQPVVKGIRVDTKFGEADAKSGPVGFAIVGANFPGAAAPGDLDTSAIQVDAKSSSGSTAIAARRVSNSRIYVQRGIGDFVTNAVDAVSSLRDFDVNKSTKLKPLDVDKTVNLIDKTIECSKGLGSGKIGNKTVEPEVGVSGKLKISAEVKAHADVTLGVAASGTIVPPKVNNFGITSSLSMDLNGAIVMSAGVGGSLDSGAVKLFEVGIPGLDFPGVLSIGPTFEVNGQAKASLNLDVDMRVGVSYKVNNAQFVFPTGGKKGGAFNPGDTPLKLSAQPSGKATGTVEAHIIPSINFGISAIEGAVDAKVFVELDASTSMTLTVEGSAPEKDATIGRRSTFERLALPAGEEDDAPAVMIPRGRGLIGSRYFAKRSPSPSPFGFGDIVDGVKGAAKKVGDGAKKVAGKVADGAKAVGSGAKKVAGKVADGAKAVAGKVEDGAKAAGSGAKKVAEKVEDGAKAVGSGAKKVAGEVKDGAEAVGSGVKKVAGKVEDGAKKVAEKVEDGVKKVVDPKPTTTKKAAPKTSSKATSATPKPTNKVDAALPPPPPKDGSFGGCLEMDAGFDVNVGADANFFGLFDPEKKLPLFSKKFTVFKKCFGDKKAQRRSMEMRDLSERWMKLEARDLVCNKVNVTGVQELANETVPAARIQ